MAGSASPNRPPGRRWRLVGVLVAGLLLASSLAIAQPGPVPGRHHDHGRFTAQQEGFPPQPIGITEVARVSGEPVAVADGPAAVRVARADQAVRSALGERFELVGTEPLDAKSHAPGGVAVTFYAHDPAQTVVATVADGRVSGTEVVPAEEWQPPLTAAERTTSIEVARRWWLDRGEQRVAELEGFSMHALQPDGTPWDTRMAYVTFHLHVDARPEFLAWVDLTGGTVTHARPDAGPQDTPVRDRSLLAGADGEPVLVDPQIGRVEWEQWSLDYELSTRTDGVALSNVRYQDVPVLARASMPAMTVFYDHPPGTPPEDVCGPFVDRLGPPELTPVYWADDAEVVLREFTLNGIRWMEIGILDTLGNYVLYQNWYLSEDGQLDAHTFAKGLQCEFDHVHYPFWRFDFDLAGPGNDEIVARTEQGMETFTSEFDVPADSAVDHGWMVRDRSTGDRVELDFDDGSWNVPGEVVPETLYAENVVYGRAVDDRESATWRRPATTDVGHNDGERIDDADLSLWYRGFLPHAAAEGPDLWHSTGVRLTFDLAPRYYTRPVR